jgi:hypothetical protein
MVILLYIRKVPNFYPMHLLPCDTCYDCIKQLYKPRWHGARSHKHGAGFLERVVQLVPRRVFYTIVPKALSFPILRIC